MSETSELLTGLMTDIPDERITCAMDAHALVRQLMRDDAQRSVRRAAVQGQIDGMAPKQQSSMTAAGKGFEANVNFRGAEGQVSVARTPYYAYATAAKPCVVIPVDFGKGSTQRRYEEIIAEEAHRMIRVKWGNFAWDTQLRQSQTIIHGIGAMTFLSETDYKPRACGLNDIFFPGNAETSLENLSYFGMRQRVAAHELYSMVARRAEAKACGWNYEAVMETLRFCGGEERANQTPQDFQAEVKQGDIAALRTSSNVELLHLFVHEYEAVGGKTISHYIVNSKGLTNEYLYRKRHKYASWESVLVLAPFDIGSDGTIYSVRGIGTRIFPFWDVFNRLMSRAIQAHAMSMGVLLKGRSQTDATKLNFIRQGLFTVIPDNMEALPANLHGFNSEVFPLINQLGALNSENTALFRSGLSSSQRPSSATEAQLLSTESSGLASAQIQHEEDALTRQYRRQVELLASPNTVRGQAGYESCMEFRARCMKRGFPEEAFNHIQFSDIAFSAGHGGGSTRERINNAMQILSVIGPSQGPAERYAMQKEFVTSVMGTRYADAFITPMDAQGLPTSDDSIAALENNSMVNGQPAIVSPGQAHSRHVPLHVVSAVQLLGKTQEGGIELAEASQAMQLLGQHIAEHITFMQDDPLLADDVKKANEQLNQLSKYADQLMQQAQAQAEAMQQAQSQPSPEQQLSEEAQLEAMRIQTKAQLKAKELEENLRLKEAKMIADTERRDKIAAAGVTRNAATTVAKIDNETARTGAYVRPNTQEFDNPQ